MSGFTNSIIGGMSTLIRAAIKSPNYVANTLGWSLNKDGSADINNLSARGAISAGNGAVLLNSGGVKVSTSTTDYEINITAGLLARAIPDDGSFAQVVDNLINMKPATPTPNGYNVSGSSKIFTGIQTNGSDDAPIASWFPPNLSGKNWSSITLVGQSGASASDNSQILLSAPDIFCNGKVHDQQPSFAATYGSPSIPNNTVTDLTPVNVFSNVRNMWSIGSIYTVPAGYDGDYEVGVTIRFASGTVGFRQVRINVNGSEYISWTWPAVNGFSTTVGGVMKIPLNVGDNVSFSVFHTQGSALSLSGSNSTGWVRRCLD